MKIIAETERLFLREMTWEDLPSIRAVVSDPETMCHYPAPYDERGARRWVEWTIENYEKHGFGWWAIVLKETGEVLGDCGITLQKIDGELLPELGYHLHRRFWRKGYGTEAARAALDHAFLHTGYDRLYSYMTQTNVASYSLAEKVGMERVKSFVDEDGESLFVYEITRERWNARREDKKD